MKKVISIIFLIVLLSSCPLFAADLYIWTDENGVKTITSKPPTSATPIDKTISYRPNDPREVEKWERQQKEAYQARERIRQQNEAREADQRAREVREGDARRAQENVQAARNKRAARLEAAIDAGIRGAGYLPAAGKIREAAAIKAQQIREGTDVPMSAAEDIAFHTEQAIRQAQDDARNELMYHKMQYHH